MMYNGSHKFGRGGGAGARGGGGPKRKSFPLPTLSAANRLSLGGRTQSSSVPPPRPEQVTADESFRLVSGEPLSLAAIFRLHPDLIGEIRRVEAKGGAAKIKFDSNPTTDGNVIDVGGKEYRFTWADEKDCDIYEERQGGGGGDGNGNGLLVETGYVWRKLTTKRELDESTSRHVKMRSLQCEQSHKSRTTKPMDPGNPSMKNQMKALVAAEASPWKQKHQFKKRNLEPSQAGAAPKPIQRPQSCSVTSTKGRHSYSPLPSPRNQYIHLASPSARGSTTETRSAYDPAISEARAKENVASPIKILSPQVTAKIPEGALHRDTQVAGVPDIECLLISLLRDNLKGMSLKALEKAVGDVTSSSSCRFEPILKKIATCEPSGRYILKPGIELESMKSSPEGKHQKYFVPKSSGGAGKSPAHDNNEHVPLNNKSGELNMVENFDPSQHLTDLFGDNEPPNHNERHAASSSNSDSDTESGSSDSGTNSASRSRSRSPVRSASASSSDSEADSSSNNKETSDVEIDIMSDDDKEPQKSLVPWSMPEARANGNNGDQHGNESEDVDIENDFLGDNEAELATSSHNLAMPIQNIKLGSHDHGQQQAYDENKFKHERICNVLNSKNKSKTDSNVVQMEQISHSVKRVKGRSVAQSSVSGYMGSHNSQSPLQTFPDTQNVNHCDNRLLQMINQQKRNDNTNVESLQLGRRPPVRSHATENAEKPAKIPLTGIDAKDQEMNAHAHGHIMKHGYTDFIEVRDEDGNINEKRDDSLKESPLGQKSSMRSEPPSKHHDVRKKSFDTSTTRHTGLSPKDTSKADFDHSSTREIRLQRELSDLEVGEFREPMVEESGISKKMFDLVGSFKMSEAKLGPGPHDEDLKANLADHRTLDPGRLPFKKMDSLSKRRSPEPYAEDVVRLQRGILSQQQNSRSVRAEVEPLPNQAVDLNRWENEEAFVNQGTDVEGYGETLRKSCDSALREDSRQELESRKGKGKKSRKSKGVKNAEDKRRDVSVGRVDKRKRNESSSDDNVPYFKYEKDEPELKGPIKSFSQYKEYVQDYRDKYDSYCSLNKILENYRNEFQKLGLDLESAKGRDMERYYNILAQLRDSYRQCGTQHKRLKKIFVVLHEELKDLKQRIKDFAVDYKRD